MDDNYGVIPIDEITKSDMEDFADHIEEYLELFEDCLVLPPGMPKVEKKSIEWAIEKTKELIKKLRKGKLSVFEDPEEYIMERRRTRQRR